MLRVSTVCHDVRRETLRYVDPGNSQVQIDLSLTAGSGNDRSKHGWVVRILDRSAQDNSPAWEDRPGPRGGNPRGPSAQTNGTSTHRCLSRKSHHGYPRFTMDGIPDHDLSVIPDIPNTDWSTAFKPWGLPALALDVEHGFAARGRLIFFFLLLGAYLLLLALTDRTDIAIVFSLALWLSPFFQWW